MVVGFSLAFGDSIGGFIGNPLTYFMFNRVGLETHPDLSPTVPLLIYAFFQLKFAIIAPALITGSFAERVCFSSYVLFMALFSLLVYCPLSHWTWHPQGFLRQWGLLDFAGGTVVHMSAGFAALAGALVLGRRRIHLASEPHVPANIPFVILGTGMLWFGWFGFNAGSAVSASGLAALAFATTNTASAADAPRAARRPAGKARRPRILSVFEGGATPPAGMHRRPNATVIMKVSTKSPSTSLGAPPRSIRCRRPLREQVLRGFCLVCQEVDPRKCPECRNRAWAVTDAFVARLPEVQRLLVTDVQTAYEGDPAATSPEETILCYPGILALVNYRLAHELHRLGVPLLPG